MTILLSAPPVRPVAFFDVDETLVAAKTMLDFWSYWQQSTGAREPHDGSDPAVLKRRGVDRESLNRAYYRRFAGVPAAIFEGLALRWYQGFRRRPGVFVAPTVAALARHRAAGHRVVLVSGSCRAMLAPLARELGAHEVVCTEELVTADGLLTGEVHRPMIGRAKGEAAAALLGAAGVAGADCFAYGDHASDLDLLRVVGHPVVVGDDPVLVAQATRNNWQIQPTA